MITLNGIGKMVIKIHHSSELNMRGDIQSKYKDLHSKHCTDTKKVGKRNMEMRIIRKRKQTNATLKS